MKQLLTRAFVRHVPAAAGIAVLCCGLTGVALTPAAASTAAPKIVTDHGTASPSHGLMPWHASVDIMITVRQTATAPIYQWTLTCRPDAGTLPDPVRACEQLSQIKQLPPSTTPRHIMCPMIVYGPELVTITGWWHGTWVAITMNRADGCDVARWNQLITALGLSGQVNPGGPMVTR